MKCPVCDRDVAGARTCPACGADLGALVALRELPALLASEGAALVQDGRVLAGVERLTAAAVLAPGEPAIRRALVDALVSAGLDELAWNQLKTVLAADGADPAARRAAERLRKRMRVRAAIDRLVRAFASYVT